MHFKRPKLTLGYKTTLKEDEIITQFATFWHILKKQQTFKSKSIWLILLMS